MRSKLTSVALLCALAFGPGAYAEPEDSDGLLRALRQELTRSAAELQQPGKPKPYFIQYHAQDILKNEFQAQDGALVHSTSQHLRPLRVEVRVGDYSEDSRGAVGGGGLGHDGGHESLVLDDEVEAMRHDVWLSTDEAYRQALRQYAMKKSLPKPKASIGVADFSAAPAVVRVEPSVAMSIDAPAWEGVVRRLSRLSFDSPSILRMRTTASFTRTTRYLVNSEGTVVRQSIPLASVDVAIECEMPDGSSSTHAMAFTGHSPQELPSEEEMARQIRDWSGQQVTWSKAPTLAEDYLGPVLFVGPAAGDLFGEGLVPLISPGTDRLHKPVLPVSITVKDDPSLRQVGSVAVVGTRAIDDEGVVTQPVTLIDQGKLNDVLSTRKPSKISKLSNGHAGVSGQEGVVPSNLVVTSSEGKSFQELKELLLRRCREDGLEFGLIVRVAGPANAGSGIRGSGISAMYYRISVATGEEELIKGVRRERLTPRGFRRLLALGNDPAAVNYLPTSGPDGYSIISPSLLLGELEVVPTPERTVERRVLPVPPKP